jgi:tRNA-dihydrouridine synthase
MVAETGCHGVMIGRGAVANPWIFWEARSALRADRDGPGERVQRSWPAEQRFWREYFRLFGADAADMGDRSPTACGRSETDAAASSTWRRERHRAAIARMKMLVRYSDSVSASERTMLLQLREDGPAADDRAKDALRYLELILECVRRQYD